MRRFALSLTTVLVLLFVASCGRSSADTGTPDLARVDAAELRAEIVQSGSQFAIVNFWATWCLPCRQEFPDLIKVGKEFADKGIVVVFVSTDMEEQEEEVRTFLTEQQVPWRSYLKRGDGYEFVQSFNEQWTGVLPATFILDASGQVVEYWEGISSYDDLVSKIERLLS